jgi:hypothetical protein
MAEQAETVSASGAQAELVEAIRKANDRETARARRS